MLRLFRSLPEKRLRQPVSRYLHHELSKPELERNLAKNKTESESPSNDGGDSVLVPGAVRNKYKVFRDEDSSEIFDVEEERHRYQIQDEPYPEYGNEFHGLNIERGLHGVFDIEDLVDVLRKESADDIFVCSVPKEIKYVDYMVVCSGRSYRHMLAMAEFVRRMYKKKRNKNEILPKIEGEKSRLWMALDLGNIALHIFSPDAREQYDLESLWAIGPEFDKECNKPQDYLVDLFEQNSILLANVAKVQPRSS